MLGLQNTSLSSGIALLILDLQSHAQKKSGGFPWMNSVDRTGIHAGGVFHAYARFVMMNATFRLQPKALAISLFVYYII